MRTNLYFRNLITGTGSMVLNAIFQFVLRWFFIKTLGAEYLGLNELFISIFAMLSLVDLGIGGVIGFSLYEPLAQKNHVKVASLIRLYRKVYAAIATVFVVIGLALIPFLPFFVKPSQNIDNLNALYLILLFNAVSGYLFSYNQVLLNADQRGYVATKINMVFSFINSFILIVVLLLAENYFYYLLVSLVLNLTVQVVIYKRVKKLYDYIYQQDKMRLSPDEYAGIVKNVKGMFFHRIGDFAVNSTDNLIISKFVSLVSVGYYSNYFMLLSVSSRFLGSIFGSLTAGLGQLLAEGGKDRAVQLFACMNFLCFWLYGIVSISFFCTVNPVINLLFGESFVFSPSVVGLLALNFYITGMRIPPHVVRSAAGVFVQDKYIPILQAVVNLVISIVAVQYWGILGVFVGTFISSILPSVARPYVACKYGLECSSRPYFIFYLKYLMFYLMLGFLSYSICSFVFPIPSLFSLLGRIFIVFLTFNVPVFIFFRKSEQAELLKTKMNLFLIFIKQRIYA